MPKSKTDPSPSLQTGARQAVWLPTLSGLLWPVQAGFIAWIIGGLLTPSEDLPIVALSGGYLAVAALRAVLDALAHRYLSRAADRQINALREEIIAAETAAAAPSHELGPGAISAQASEKLELLRPHLLRYSPARLKATVLPLVILAITFWHSWAVGLVLLLAGPLIPVFMALVGWAAKSASARQMTEVGQMSDLLVDRLAALADLRLIGAGDALIAGFAQASENLRHRTMAVLRIAFLSSTVLELFAALGVAMVAIWVGFTLLGDMNWGSWGRTLSPTVGIYLLLLAPDYFQPLRDLSAAWHDRAGADAVLDEIAAWRAEERPRRIGAGMPATVAAGGSFSLDLQGLGKGCIAYPDLTLGQAETLAITGPSGSGKTTLLRLIAGLERPDRGAVLIDRLPLAAGIADDWRGGIGWMPQAPHFLNRSLRYNIGFGAPVSEDLIRAAHLQDVLARLPKGAATQLGERGAGLSGGEARRVTLARAMHGDPRLILADEPTADLDAETAGLITDNLIAFAKAGGSVIIATHDPVLAARMDRHIHLGGGDVA